VAVSAAPAEIGAALDAKRRPPEAVLEHVEPGADLIVGLASFIVLHSTTSDESTSRIVARLHPGAAVTSHPEFREGLEREGRELGFI
jgi:hypothetical protein